VTDGPLEEALEAYRDDTTDRRKKQ
jgi:hypothetical protein